MVLLGIGWSAPCPSHFTPRKETQYQSYRRLGGAGLDGSGKSHPHGVQTLTASVT